VPRVPGESDVDAVDEEFRNGSERLGVESAGREVGDDDRAAGEEGAHPLRPR
jgi:hypothetical protein